MGSLKIPGYQVFEKTRNTKGGGGLLTAVDEDLEPVLISTGTEEAETLTVETKVGDKRVRIINGYGPQEDDDKQTILNFWQEIEKEVVAAKDDGCMVIIEMDANAKVGNQVIKMDPHEQSNNGKILVEFALRQDLAIVNSHNRCKGAITRERAFENKVEKSIIDYVLVCQELLQYLIQMTIDQERIFVLTNHLKKKNPLNRLKLQAITI